MDYLDLDNNTANATPYLYDPKWIVESNTAMLIAGLLGIAESNTAMIVASLLALVVLITFIVVIIWIRRPVDAEKQLRRLAARHGVSLDEQPVRENT